MKERYKSLVIAGAIAFAGMISVTPAHATLAVQLNGTNSAGTISGGLICQDGAACDADHIVNNSILWAAPLMPGVTFAVSGVNVTSAAPIGDLSLTMNGTPSAPTSFTIAVTDFGFTIPGPPLVLKQTTSGLNGGGTTATFNAVGYFFNGTAQFNTSGPSTTTATATVNDPAGTGTSAAIASGSPYSLTEFVTVNISHVGTGNLQINADLLTTPVPEPASMALFGTFLLLTAGVIRRKRRA